MPIPAANVDQSEDCRTYLLRNLARLLAFPTRIGIAQRAGLLGFLQNIIFSLLLVKCSGDRIAGASSKAGQDVLWPAPLRYRMRERKELYILRLEVDVVEVLRS